jgi:hypothetical protein
MCLSWPCPSFTRGLLFLIFIVQCANKTKNVGDDTQLARISKEAAESGQEVDNLKQGNIPLVHGTCETQTHTVQAKIPSPTSVPQYHFRSIHMTEYV